MALDRHANDVINDGTELFGPRPGDGYAELSQYDVDGNQLGSDELPSGFGVASEVPPRGTRRGSP